MNDQRVEGPSDEQLGRAYAALVSTTQPPPDLQQRIRAGVARRRRARRIRLLVAACAAVVTLVVGVMAVRATPVETPVVATGPSTGIERTTEPSAPTSPARTGPLPDGQADQCAFPYDRAHLGEREWAVDATVTELDIGPDSARVVLTVHHWYRGGAGEQVTAVVPVPDVADDVPPAYDIGSRLLMSGDRDGRRYVGFGCGFSRYYDAATAADWEDVFH